MHFLSSTYGNRELEMTLEKNSAQLQWVKHTGFIFYHCLYFKTGKTKTFTIYNYFLYLTHVFHSSNI